MIQTPFFLGKLRLPNNIFYAPLAGCSDYPFRTMAAKYSPGLMYCEMVKMEALIRNDSGTYHLLDFDRSMHPIGGQLCGSRPQIAGQAAKIIQDLGFDVVDLNCGCPVDKITKDGSGSGLLKTPELIGDILANMVAAVNIPVTLKIRAGWDDQTINAPLITQIAEQAGAKAICIHGRTRQQAYKGLAKREYIKACKEVAKSILVIGNGDLFDAKAVKEMFEETHCDAVLLSRGTMGQPWLVEEIFSVFQGKPLQEKTPQEIKQALKEHFYNNLRYHPPKKAIIEMRRIGCWYFKKNLGTKTFREKMSRVENAEDVLALIETL